MAGRYRELSTQLLALFAGGPALFANLANAAAAIHDGHAVRDEVARAGGADVSELAEARDRGAAVTAMAPVRKPRMETIECV